MEKGFTLVELLAVIAILAIISTIAIPSAFKFSKNIKKDMYCEKVEMILNEAKRWGNEHTSSLRTACYIEKTVGQLADAGYIKKEQAVSGKYVANPYKDGFMDQTKVKIFLKNKIAVAVYAETDSELKTLCESSVSSVPVTRC